MVADCTCIAPGFAAVADDCQRHSPAGLRAAIVAALRAEAEVQLGVSASTKLPIATRAKRGAQGAILRRVAARIERGDLP